MLVLCNGVVELGVSGITVAHQSLKVGNISIEFGVEALVILDGIGEFFNLAILFLELFAVGIKIQFLSINPVYMVVNGGHVLSDCVFVGLDCVDVVCDFGVFCHDNCL